MSREEEKEQLAECSGEESDEDEQISDEEPDVSVDGNDDGPAKLYSKGIISAGKEKNTDIAAKECTVLCNFYKTENGQIALALPRLPPIETQHFHSETDDYASYGERMSSWFAHTEKKSKNLKPPPRSRKKYQCIKCEWSFDSAAGLIRHKEVHENPGIFACQACFVLFGHAPNLYGHWRHACSQVAECQNDAKNQNFHPLDLRKLVLCAMGSEGRAQQFHVFGGIIYIPSTKFLNSKYNLINPIHQSTCHLCYQMMPTKYIECHGDVHRGRFRIDGKIYGDHFCHVCGMIFSKKESLIQHWRHDCPELVTYTPTDVYLDDEELTGLAWLVLQTTVPHEQIVTMAKNFSLMVNNWARRHAREHGLLNCLDLYHHFPQEIWPLPLNIGLDFIRDALPIYGPGAFIQNVNKETNIRNPNIPCHVVNLLAMSSPDFYATGMSFVEISALQKVGTDPRTIFRVVLRYSTAGSVIGSYKLNARTCPSLRPQKLEISNFQPADFNVEAQFQGPEPESVDSEERYLHAVQWPSEARYSQYKEANKPKKPIRLCPLCQRITANRCQREHWLSECIPLKVIIPNPEQRGFADERFVTNIIGPLRDYSEVKYEWISRRRGVDRNPPQKETIERIGEKHKISFLISDKNLEKLKKALVQLLGQARDRWRKRVKSREHFKPTEELIVVCPHCGGRYHNLVFYDHLKNRHFYPTIDNKTLFEEWRSQKYSTYQFVNELIDNSEYPIEMTMMSEERYNKCCQSHSDPTFNETNDLRNKSSILAPWSADQTLREVDLVDPLIVSHDGIAGNASNAIVAPEPIYPMKVYFPKDLKTVKNLKKKQRGGVENFESEEETQELVDPYTKEVLTGPFLEAVLKHNREFFGENGENNPLDVASILEFLGSSDEEGGSSEEDSENEEIDPSAFDLDDEEDDDDDDEISEKGSEDSESDEEIEEPKKKRGKFVSEFDEPSLGAETEEEDKDDDNKESKVDKLLETEPDESRTAMAYRKKLKKEEKAKKIRLSKVKLEPIQHKPEKFKERSSTLCPDKIDPSFHLQLNLDLYCNSRKARARERKRLDQERRRLMQMYYFKHKRANDEVADRFGARRLPDLINYLSIDFENVCSDFRLSAANFYRYYTKSLPPSEYAIQESELTEKQKQMSMTYDEFMKKVIKAPPVVCPGGLVFLGGFLRFLRDDDDQSVKLVYVIKDGWANPYQILYCKDPMGKFKLYWPQEPNNEDFLILSACERFLRRPCQYSKKSILQNRRNHLAISLVIEFARRQKERARYKAARKVKKATDPEKRRELEAKYQALLALTDISEPLRIYLPGMRRRGGVQGKRQKLIMKPSEIIERLLASDLIDNLLEQLHLNHWNRESTPQIEEETYKLIKKTVDDLMRSTYPKKNGQKKSTPKDAVFKVPRLPAKARQPATRASNGTDVPSPKPHDVASPEMKSPGSRRPGRPRSATAVSVQEPMSPRPRSSPTQPPTKIRRLSTPTDDAELDELTNNQLKNQLNMCKARSKKTKNKKNAELENEIQVLTRTLQGETDPECILARNKAKERAVQKKMLQMQKEEVSRAEEEILTHKRRTRSIDSVPEAKESEMMSEEPDDWDEVSIHLQDNFKSPSPLPKFDSPVIRNRRLSSSSNQDWADRSPYRSPSVEEDRSPLKRRTPAVQRTPSYDSNPSEDRNIPRTPSYDYNPSVIHRTPSYDSTPPKRIVSRTPSDDRNPSERVIHRTPSYDSTPPKKILPRTPSDDRIPSEAKNIPRTPSYDSNPSERVIQRTPSYDSTPPKRIVPRTPSDDRNPSERVSRRTPSYDGTPPKRIVPRTPSYVGNPSEDRNIPRTPSYELSQERSPPQQNSDSFEEGIITNSSPPPQDHNPSPKEGVNPEKSPSEERRLSPEECIVAIRAQYGEEYADQMEKYLDDQARKELNEPPKNGISYAEWPERPESSETPETPELDDRDSQSPSPLPAYDPPMETWTEEVSKPSEDVDERFSPKPSASPIATSTPNPPDTAQPSRAVSVSPVLSLDENESWTWTSTTGPPMSISFPRTPIFTPAACLLMKSYIPPEMEVSEDESEDEKEEIGYESDNEDINNMSHAQLDDYQKRRMTAKGDYEVKVKKKQSKAGKRQKPKSKPPLKYVEPVDDKYRREDPWKKKK
uniref:C2H2-type domain-containing protein n=1 Tax=Caenorhabditis tropicalis TaxID=1561998 RepID=A0A1I7UD49_9PELO